MYSDILSARVRELKESEKGVEEMCKELEEIYNEGEQSGVQKGIQKGELKKARETVFALLEMGHAFRTNYKSSKNPADNCSKLDCGNKILICQCS